MRILIPIAIIAFLIWLMNWPLVRVGNHIWAFLASAPIFWLIIVGAVILGIVLNSLPALWTTIALAFVIGIPLQVAGNNIAFYNASNIDISEAGAADELSYNERVPFEVAIAVSDRSLGDTTGTSNGVIRAIPEDSSYNALIIRKGVFQGYEAVQSMNLPEFGSFSFKEDITFCTFDEKASYRFGGMGFNNNIMTPATRIASGGYNPTILINEKDSFAVCDGDTPMVYIPATAMKYEGLLSYRVPAGVVIYNGKTGEFDYSNDTTIDGLPIYPLSLAASQRESTKWMTGMFDRMLGKSGWKTTNEKDQSVGESVAAQPAKDESEQTNYLNSSEFALTNLTTNKAQYVTPLTPRGSSTSVTAISTIDTSTIKKGELNQLSIHKYETPRQSPSTIEASVVATALSGYKANGLTVFEVIPAADGTWSASIGKNQSILYRANIDSDGEITLRDVNGVIETINSEPDSPETMPEAPQKEEEAPKSPEPEESEKGSQTPVSEMTVEELKDLMDQLTAELAKRATN